MEYGILAGIVGFVVGFFIGIWAVYKIVDLIDKYKD